MEDEIYGPKDERSAARLPKSASGYLFNKQERMTAIGFLILVACGLPLALFFSFEGQWSLSYGFAVSLGAVLIWIACLASTRIRQEAHWDGSGLVLWNYLGRLSYKRVIEWSELRCIRVHSPETAGEEIYLEFHCLRSIYRSPVGTHAEMMKVKEAILIEQARSSEGKAFIAREIQRREKVLSERRVRIKQSMSEINFIVLTISSLMTLFFCAGFMFYGIAKNPFPYGFAILGTVFLLNYLALQLFQFELSWDDQTFTLTTKFLGIPSKKKIQRQKIVSISSSTVYEGETLYTCLRFTHSESADDIIFARRIHPTRAQWIEETLQIVLKESQKALESEAKVS